MSEKEILNLDAETSHETEQQEAKKPAWGRRKVMRFFVAPIFAVLAVAALIAAILSLTVLKPSPYISAQADTSANYVVTSEGVANLISGNVEVSAQADGEVCVAVANTTDAQAWLDAHDDTKAEVTGLESWTKLSVKKSTSKSNAQESVDFKDSDLWQNIECADNSAKISLTGASASQRILVYSTSGVKSVQMKWLRPSGSEYDQATPWFAAMTVLAICALLSATWLASADPFGVQHRKLQKAAQEEARRQADGAEALTSTPNTRHRNAQSGLFSQFFNHQKSSAETGQSEAQPQPIVIDPSSVNLVGSTGAGAADTAWSPSLINYPTIPETENKAAGAVDAADLSGEELLEYLARLAIQDRKEGSHETSESNE